jgi:hypothetical protein
VPLVFAALAAVRGSATGAAAYPETSASTSAPQAPPAGAIDGDRFSLAANAYWKGAVGAGSWWWQICFPAPRPIGAILQINGDRPTILANAPARYRWLRSDDGAVWHDLAETAIAVERRLFRLHRLARPVTARCLRIAIDECCGDAPALREVEVYAAPDATIPFPDWVVAVSTRVESRALPRETESFVGLVRQCPGWGQAPAQNLWLGDFSEAFLAAEPRPVCVFLSGNSVEWCQQPREPWRGVAEVFAHRAIPIWASCGGAQALAILQETGLDNPWDCPRCRDPRNPRAPVYSHIGHTGPAKCGDYSKNIAERGKFTVRLAARDPAFAGLGETFEVMESHVGQIDYVPPGWVRVATNGPGAHTENQCLRLQDRYIYAAQFHIEMRGTPEVSRTIMANFLSLAKAWGGYNPTGALVAPPAPLHPKHGPAAPGAGR